MKFYEKGKENKKSIMFIPGNMMSWRQFREVMQELSDTFHVIVIGLDGFDESENTRFEGFEQEADKITDWILAHLDGKLDVLFGESVCMGIGISLTRKRELRIRKFIMDGPQWLDYGVINEIYRWMPISQYRLIKKLNNENKKDKIPFYMKYFIRRSPNEMEHMISSICRTATKEDIYLADHEAWKMFMMVPCWLPIETTHAYIWYGSKEPNIRRAVGKLSRLYPRLDVHAFPGFGHGEIVDHPKMLAEQIRKIVEE